MKAQVSTTRTGVNIASQWALHLAIVGVNMFLIAYVLDRVGPEHYGGWAIIISIVGYMHLLGAGLSQAVQHFTPADHTRGDDRGMSALFSSACIVYGLAALLALPGSLAVARYYAAIWPKIPTQAAAECSQALLWVSAAIVFSLLCIPAQGVLLGLQRHYLRNLIELVALIVRATVVVVTFQSLGPSLAYLGAALCAGACCRFVLYLLSLRIVAPGLRLNLSLVSRQALKRLLGFAGHSAVWSVCTVLLRDSGPLLAAWMLGPAEITYLYAGTRVVRAFSGQVVGAGAVFLPIVSSLYATGEKARLGSVLVRGSRFGALIGLSGGACLILFGPAILYHWLGPGQETTLGVLVATTICLLGHWCFGMATIILVGTRALKTVTAVQLTQLVGGIALGVVFSLAWGVTGLAAGLLLPLLLISLAVTPACAVRRAETGLAKLYLKALWAPAVVAGAVGLAAWAMQRLWPPQQVWILVTEGLLAMGFFGILSMLFGLDRATRKQIAQRLRGRFRAA